MTQHTIDNLLETRRKIVKAVGRGEMSGEDGAKLLGITRQGLWKIRKRVGQLGYTRKALIGRKRGPKTYQRAWNRTYEEIEDLVCSLYDQYLVGPDRLGWLLEDRGIEIHRSTIYRILVRKKRIIPRERKNKHRQLYAKGYPGCEVQIDTTEPFGKGKPVLISAIDDHTRWGFADLYQGNSSANAARFLAKINTLAPFKIHAVRADNGGEFQKDFKKECQKLGIHIIRNPPDSPRRNGKVERFHRTIEEECLWRVGITGDRREHARKHLAIYLSWYNHQRHHGGYGMDGLRPIEKLDQFINRSLTQEVEVNETVVLYNIVQNTQLMVV